MLLSCGGYPAAVSLLAVAAAQAVVPTSSLAVVPVIELVVVASIVTVQCGAAAELASTPVRTVTPGATCCEVHWICWVQSLPGAAEAGTAAMAPSSGRPASTAAAGYQARGRRSLKLREFRITAHLRGHDEHPAS